ncbi:H/ACA ribonucleoprotein complex subunit GAR1 [Halorarum salinum]|uniref:H/ACA RNA-protein complex component Gar1 n=1 Tax=Halorarum salinum TaxID=2743089 RepID=A0A7D5L8D9_9EURY|nr:Gar1/Naf1 family protein [Halobaculum salinum]QLG60488.1 H/ACA RNA-protein complex component Gar1 [Halobaculum salinum]
MRRVGEVVRTAGGVAVVRVPSDEDPVDVGTMVVDDSLSTVGRVVDVFGPVSRPYVAVTPNDGAALTELLGKPLYAR